MVKYYCDRCGKEIPYGFQSYKIWYTSKRYCFQYEDEKEVCKECYDKIVDFIKEKK